MMSYHLIFPLPSHHLYSFQLHGSETAIQRLGSSQEVQRLGRVGRGGVETWRAEEWDRRQSTKVHLESAHATSSCFLSSLVVFPTQLSLPSLKTWLQTQSRKLALSNPIIEYSLLFPLAFLSFVLSLVGPFSKGFLKFSPMLNVFC